MSGYTPHKNPAGQALTYIFNLLFMKPNKNGWYNQVHCTKPQHNSRNLSVLQKTNIRHKTKSS